tara:strand:- start:71 stop:646 length:576 start_codon:yes stop_codon:yes gene_type:complete
MKLNTPTTRTISSKDTAKLIRKTLKSNWAHIKFSVRSDHNSINIRWTDGPSSAEVDAIVQGYKGGGFDGMIDLAYSNTSWLMPDGTATPAACDGTTGSVPAYVTDAPHPDAELVDFRATYIFTQREITNLTGEMMAAAGIIYRTCVIEGDRQVDGGKFGGRWVNDLVHMVAYGRRENESREAAVNRIVLNN